MIKRLQNQQDIWKRIEIVGDIVIIGVPFNKKPEDLIEIANKILSAFPYIKSVWGRYRDVSGTYRLPTYVHLAGEKRSETIYKEHKCKYFLDFTKVFFSEKLSYEHLRVARQVKRGEIIINMFSGFGPFSILSAVLSKPKVVYSIDVNPYAYYYMMVNVELNKAYEVLPIYGDAFKRIYDLEDADRIIAPLPELADKAYEVALQRVKKGGVIHLYTEVEAYRGEDPVKIAMNKYNGSYFGRIVRSVNPHKYHVAVDIKVT
ncbi:class I SAM-dependent methyltransferase family protein [Sulfolobus sp. E5-1-F]|uniref:tRNA 4-demethylwyosine(37)-methyltransferase Taw21 n=1 Tax=Sulfolobaceae TaxID=118883 RepID=UPI001298059A|nr:MULTISPECIES: class I SAM-dependent methyltransferase family protein [unclassified Sulfolobus]QGA53579.1 class I SAM-dependent methyltransferase family protein [Sulfolobus sp. E5-1-F]QGA68756.1 class I SAM-dependent methyltransferase family protein [Sulfolobus sp. E11-6]